MASEGLNPKFPDVRERKTSSRTLGVRTIGAAGRKLKELWADPVWRAQLLAKRSAIIASRTEFKGRYGVPDGMRKRDADKAWAEAREKAEQTMEDLKQAGVVSVDKTEDDKHAVEALTEALTVMRSPQDQKLRLSAAALVLKYTKSPPPTKTELAISEAEAWLKQVAKDNEQPSGDA